MISALNADRRIFLSRARLGMKRLGLDALMVTSEQGVRYLSSYHCSGALMLLFSRMKPVYFVDSMNYSLALKTLTGQPIDLIMVRGDKMPAAKEYMKRLGVRKLGIEEDTMPVATYDRCKALLKGIRFFPGSSVLREARLLKTPGEVRLIRKAASETMKIWRSVSRKIRPGMSELRIAGMINAAIHEKGYTNSFETIVAAGTNSAYPHAIPTEKVLKSGEHLVLDFGIRLRGYCSDLTRVWGEGRIVRKIGLLQKHVRIAHDRVINIIRSGVTVGALAAEADRYFEENGLGKYVCHGLGHGVGLEVHEAPSLGSKDRGYKLKTGMVVTVEPGLYIPGVGGVRVEDMVLVTKNGCEVLTQ